MKLKLLDVHISTEKLIILVTLIAFQFSAIANEHLQLPKLPKLSSTANNSVQDPCLEMLEHIMMDPDILRENPMSMFRRILHSAKIDWSMQNEYLNDLMAIGLSNAELNAFAQTAKIQVANEDDVLRILNVLRYAKNQPEHLSVEAIRTIFRRISNEKTETSRLASFIRSKGFGHYNKFLNFERKMNMREDMYYTTVAKGSSREERLKAARLWRLEHERRYLACRAPIKTPEQKKAFKLFSYFTSGAGVGLYTGVYYLKERDRLQKLRETGNSDSANNEVKRELYQSALSTAAIIATFANNRASGLKKWLKLYGAFAVAGLADPLWLNNTSDEYMNKAISFSEKLVDEQEYEEVLRGLVDQIQTDFDLVNIREELKRKLHNEVAREDFITTINQYISNSNLSEEDKENYSRVNRDQDVYEFTKSDQRLSEWIEKGEITDEQALAEFQFIMATYYYEQTEGLIHSGNVGWDRYHHSRLWTIPGAAKDIILGQVIYDMLCIFGFNWKTLLIGSSLNLANILATSYLFVENRNYMLNTPEEETMLAPVAKFIDRTYNKIMNSDAVESLKDFKRKATTVVTEAP